MVTLSKAGVLVFSVEYSKALICSLACVLILSQNTRSEGYDRDEGLKLHFQILKGSLIGKNKTNKQIQCKIDKPNPKLL